MAVNPQHAFNAADVADAVFSSMLLRGEWNAVGYDTHADQETLKILIESIDHGLKSAGVTFAEYLERIRHAKTTHTDTTTTRWRFSARERAIQGVDSAVAHLCELMQHPSLDS